MRILPTILLALLMWSFLGLGFYGLIQQVAKQVRVSQTSIERLR